MPLGWQVLELAQPDYSTTKESRYMHKALSIVKLIEPMEIIISIWVYDIHTYVLKY